MAANEARLFIPASFLSGICEKDEWSKHSVPFAVLPPNLSPARNSMPDYFW